MSEEIVSNAEGGAIELPLLIEKLVVLHGDKWLTFVRRMVRNREDAEDVLQESTLKMLTHRRCFQSPDEVRMYFSRVISNTAIEAYHMRRRQRLQRCPLYESALVACDGLDPAMTIAGADERQKIHILNLLHQGLKRLPIKQYEALRMTLMAPVGASIRDAGAEHAIPYSTLRHRRVQGLRRLRRFLIKALAS